LLKLPPGLKELNLSNNPNLGNETFRVLAEEVLDSPSCKLEKLILEGCKLSDTGLKPLAKVLEYNSTIRFLDLSRNLIRDQGAVDLSNMILGNNTMSVLFLHWNKLQPRGGLALAKALSKNTSLQILDLSYCSLGGSRENMEKVI
jgi:Ran GTPase-activating protein (RanGAP) involved in mRNA processing and transport